MTTLIALLICSAAVPQQGDFAAALTDARKLARAGAIPETTRGFQRAIDLAANPDQQAQGYYELAGFLAARNQRAAAVSAFEKLLAITPPTDHHAPALDRLARIHQRSGELPLALGAYQRLAALPDGGPRDIQRGLWGQVRTHQQIGSLDDAVAPATRLLTEFPDSTFARQAAGVLIQRALDAEDFAAARKLAQHEADHPNGNPTLLIVVANAMTNAGAFAAALEVAEAFHAARPADIAGYHLLYDVHARQGSLPEYEKELVAAADRPDDSTDAMRRLADLYSRQDKPTEALDILEELAGLLPDDAELPASAARMAMRLHRPEQAVELYRRALEIQPDRPSLRLQLGDAYAEMGHREEAMAQWKQGLRYDATNPSSARILGRRLLAQGCYRDALGIYREARETAGDPTVLALEMGEAYEALLFIQEAAAEYVLAMRGGRGASAHASRRLLLLADDDAARPDVIASLEAARDADPPPGALAALGLAHLNSGALADATAAFGAIPDPDQRGLVLLRTASEFQRAGDRATAIALLAAATEADLPASFAGRIALALADLHAESDDWREARRVLQGVAIAQCPPDIADRIRLALADILVLRAGDFEGAAGLYAQVLGDTGNEMRRRAAWGLADCAFIAGEYTQAAQAYRDLAAEEPPESALFSPFPSDPAVSGYTPAGPSRPMGLAYAAYQLAEIVFRSGRFTEARGSFEAVADQHPNSRYANDALARVLLIATEFTGASPAEGKYVEALRLMDRGDTPGASRILEMIASLGPDEPLADDAALLQADGLARFGDCAEAAKEYAAIAEAFPDSPLAPEALLRAADLTARSPDARQDALGLYRMLLARFPNSPEAPEAEMGIDDLLRG